MKHPMPKTISIRPKITITTPATSPNKPAINVPTVEIRIPAESVNNPSNIQSIPIIVTPSGLSVIQANELMMQIYFCNHESDKIKNINMVEISN